ncbi:MAG TPA: DUF493 domain-containing protein [Gammaproteobacteria bacterium]|nr:DUF493 domain-containing protein [Gammaproteobacteria bacterium]
MTETADSALKFPCDFPIKALGAQREDFDRLVVAIVRRHVPDLGEGAVSTRTSRGGNYLSVTVTVRATSRAQLDAIYRDLVDCEHVMMAL